MNQVFLMGNLTRDIELKETVGGKTYTRVGLAVRRQFSKDKDAVDFFNLVAWDRTAEMMSKYLSKGNKILVEGRLQTNSYEKNGVKVSTYDVIVGNVEFADSKEKSVGSRNRDDAPPFDEDDTPF